MILIQRMKHAFWETSHAISYTVINKYWIKLALIFFVIGYFCLSERCDYLAYCLSVHTCLYTVEYIDICTIILQSQTWVFPKGGLSKSVTAELVTRISLQGMALSVEIRHFIHSFKQSVFHLSFSTFVETTKTF